MSPEALHQIDGAGRLAGTDPTSGFDARDLQRLESGELFADELRSLELGGLAPDERERLLGRLHVFVQVVEERCRHLRAQLDQAEAARARLVAEVRRHDPAGGPGDQPPTRSL